MSGSAGRVPLPDDIVGRIMTFCSTFDTLQATVLVSKAFYRVFQTHPKASGICSTSITTAVAYNIVGPALPQAWRVIRYPYDEYDEYSNTPDGNSSVIAAACPENPHPLIVPGDEQALLENGRVVAALEDIYSLRNKDNKSRASVLTLEESWRFRRAMYRIMLYCKLFPCDRYDTDEMLDMDAELVGKIRMQRTAVLSEYPTDELRELWSAVTFLVSTLESVDVYDERVLDPLLSTGPSGVLRAWKAHSPDVLEDDIDVDFLLMMTGELILFEGYFSLPLENICSERRIAPPKADEPESKWILGEVTSVPDFCSRCGCGHAVELYNETNWDRLPVPLEHCLKDYLEHNQTLLEPFHTAIPYREDSDALGLFIGDLFAFKTRTAPEFDHWERTGSYCAPCLTEFLREHLWFWLLEEGVRGGQISDTSHAEQKNHLCIPIKDEDPA
ncbi:hypothetical protein B0H12DRAFT_1076358 [Mycena haematopus]|nr:hypothetical protein B0H12DRAFT_1076358 [Mycena haematopus]